MRGVCFWYSKDTNLDSYQSSVIVLFFFIIIIIIMIIKLNVCSV